MKQVKRSWDLLSEKKRQSAIEEIMRFFQKERDEKIGAIAAEEVLDFFLQTVGDEFYNRGVEDAKEAMTNRFGDLDVDLDLLLKK